MAKTNLPAKAASVVTHEGGKAARSTPLRELTRAVSCCMLWEDTFYEKGSSIADRIAELVPKVSLEEVSLLARRARTDLKLRHAPLFLCLQMLKHPQKEDRNIIGETIAEVIQRADELAEIWSIYRKIGGKSEPRQLKAGVAKAFRKFNEYELAKYNRDGAVKLRDALFMSHAKPENKAQAKLWDRLIKGELKTPDTWEVALSAGEDKGETFTRLLVEEKLGYMALLRNLRNMSEAKVDRKLVETQLIERSKGSCALPFRFVAAARFAPDYADALNDALLGAIDTSPRNRLEGETAIALDVSGSMSSTISEKSKMRAVDAGGALACLLREICSPARVFQFGSRCKEMPNYRGLPLVDWITTNHDVDHGTEIGHAVETILHRYPDVKRLFIVTDMQSADDPARLPAGVKGYYINVMPYAPALPTFGKSWTIISGFSERIIDWVRGEEATAE